MFEDAAVQGRYLESFLVESWVEHMRQHHRATVADEEITSRVRAYHVGPEAPRVSHFISTGPV